ncbi:hypothetical protein CXF83_18820 [Shewanella sp. Choline-02u-19]|uniref:hypothetical protein n=1 Tax=unclassified Shewanella TaxID=196818 RepID=UPI000C322E8C|nr:MULTISPECIES: hypothetical protein [unclassified Shewanella]PKH54556.1 hypothetical protein CXF84_20025 [Shewanella sp. Bg11-22]PKI28614.1 hypothetical protein CXF83_18820 [Shewanella sp. Choline-02u-19]
MPHCSSPLFINDIFCPDCGDKIETPPSIKPLTQQIPDILDNLKTHCPYASVYTGWVEKTHHYQRVYRSGGNDSQTLYYSYWFLTLNNEQNEPMTISISSEDSSFDSVAKGDVMTFLQPTSYSLNYKLANDADRNIVTHNEAATAVVFHRDSGQESILESAYDVEEFSTFSILLSTLFWSCAAAASGMFFELYTIEIAATLAALVTLVWSTYRISSKTKTFKAETTRLDEIECTIKRILSVSVTGMGYDRRDRPSNHSDVYCIRCEHLLDSNYHYCHCCGESQVSVMAEEPSRLAQNALENQTNLGHNDTNVAIQSHALAANSVNVTPITKANGQRMTRRDKIIQVCAPFATVEKTEHQHKHIFAKNYQCVLSTSSNIVRVTDKEVGTSVSDDTNFTTTTTRTDYRNGYGNVRSEYKTETSSHRQRNSNLYGELIVETPEGEVHSFKAVRSLLGSTDVGDWILLGSSKIESTTDKIGYDEFYYNISKDNLIEPESLTSWGRVSSKSQTIVILMLALAVASTIYFHDIMNIVGPLVPELIWNLVFGLTNLLTLPINYTPMVLFSLFFVVVLVVAKMYANNTKRKLHSALKPLQATLKKCQQARESFNKI